LKKSTTAACTSRFDVIAWFFAAYAADCCARLPDDSSEKGIDAQMRCRFAWTPRAADVGTGCSAHEKQDTERERERETERKTDGRGDDTEDRNAH
jgi:hypothetical protein